MEFSSLEFLFRFLPIFLIIYYLVPVKYKNPVLFFGSLVFYAMGSWKDALLLLFSMSLNYILVLLMDYIRRKSSRNTMLVILLCYNIGLLCIFKYTRLSLPLGISFVPKADIRTDCPVCQYGRAVKETSNPSGENRTWSDSFYHRIGI